MKQVIYIFLFFLTINFVYAQQRGIHLIAKEGNKREYLAENRRIKIKMRNGDRIAGQFVILDSTTIVIKGSQVSLDSIVKIRKASTFTAIAKPLAMTTGGILATSGIAMLSFAESPYSVIGIIPLFYGAAFIIVPLTVRKHSSEKWDYKIEN